MVIHIGGIEPSYQTLIEKLDNEISTRTAEEVSLEREQTESLNWKERKDPDHDWNVTICFSAQEHQHWSIWCSWWAHGEVDQRSWLPNGQHVLWRGKIYQLLEQKVQTLLQAGTRPLHSCVGKSTCNVTPYHYTQVPKWLFYSFIHIVCITVCRRGLPSW